MFIQILILLRSSSVFPPLILAFSAFIEDCHGLISRADLNLHEVSPFVPTLMAFSCGLIDIFPSFLATEDIIDLLSFKLHLLFEDLRYYEDVGTSFAEKPKV